MAVHWWAMTSIGVHDDLGLGLSFSQLGSSLGYSPTISVDAVADDEGMQSPCLDVNTLLRSLPALFSDSCFEMNSGTGQQNGLGAPLIHPLFDC